MRRGIMKNRAVPFESADAARVERAVELLLTYGLPQKAPSPFMYKQKYSLLTRMLCAPVMLIACSPCIVWSAVARILWLPRVCLGDGCHYVIADNPLSCASDLCIAECHDQVYNNWEKERMWLVDLMRTDATYNTDDFVYLLQLLRAVFETRGGAYQRFHYALADIMFGSCYTPAQAKAMIAAKVKAMAI